MQLWLCFSMLLTHLLTIVKLLNKTSNLLFHRFIFMFFSGTFHYFVRKQEDKKFLLNKFTFEKYSTSFYDKFCQQKLAKHSPRRKISAEALAPEFIKTPN